MMKPYLPTTVFWLFLAATATAQTYSDNFEGTNNWLIQNLLPSQGWEIDDTPAVFVSPTRTLNNADTLVGLSESGTGSATSPGLNVVAGTVHIQVRFSCRYTLVEDNATMRRRMNLGTGTPIGTIHASFFFDSPDTTNDDVTPSADQFVIACPAGGDWHSHTIEARVGGSEVFADGVALSGSAASHAAVINASSLSVDFFFQWTQQLNPVPPPANLYGIVFWAVDDFVLEGTAIAAGGGGEGGSIGFCILGAPVAGPRAPVPTAFLALLAWLAMAGRRRERGGASRYD